MSNTTNFMDQMGLANAANEASELENDWVETALGVEDAEVEARFQKWRRLFDLNDDYHLFQLRRLVTESIRLERCQKEESARRLRTINRARMCWEVDRGADALILAAKLRRNPQRWRQELMRSAQGCRWMIEQWQGLQSIWLSTQTWDDRQRSLALDLLGISPLFREGQTPLDPPEGAEADWLASRIKQEIDTLNQMVEESLDPIDAFEREQSEQGLTLSFDRETQALRRFEAGCQRRYYQLLRLLAPFRVNAPAKPSTPEKPRAASTINYRTAPILDLIRQYPTLRNKTERCSDRREPGTAAESSNPDTRKARPAPPLSSGNRRERRKAAAMARKNG